MVDFGAISGAVASLKAASDITKAMIGLRDAAMMQSKIIELQGAILEAQNALFSVNQERASLIEKIGELEKQVASAEGWETQQQRYELVEIGGGNVAYSVKPSMRGTEAPHYACATCFKNGKVAILQITKMGAGMAVVCPTCDGSALIRNGFKPPR